MAPDCSNPSAGLRRRSLRGAGALSCALLASILLASCRSEVPPATAVVGVVADFESINELIVPGSAFNDAIVDRLFLQLADERPDYGSGPATFEPRLAESWSFDDDRSSLTFRLRDDVLWSDGMPVTAGDVRFSWQAQTHPGVAWNYAFVKEAITDVEVVDERTVRFHFSEPSSTQLADANEGVILPSHVWGRLPFERWREIPEWFAENQVTSGPFRIERHDPGQQVVLVRNDRYYEEGLPRLDRVVFRRLGNRTALVDQLLAGELHLIRTPDPSDVERLRGNEGIRIVEYPSRQFNFVSWNVGRPYFDDPSVRRALALAVDRQEIVDTLWYGLATVGFSPIVSGVWPHHPDLEPWPYDPERARRLFDEAGWVDRDGDGVRERDGVELRFELSTNPGSELRWNAMQMIQEQLGRVGAAVELRQIDYATLSARNLAHDYDATVVGLLMDTTLDLSYLIHSDAIDNGYNFGQYSNPEIDRLVDEVGEAIDKRDVEPALLRIQEILHQDQPLLFLWEPRGFLAVRNELLDVHPDTLSAFSDMRHWRIAPAD
jgi:peptide/nickel transport system substrate-binding protein